MRIGINALYLLPGKVGGSEIYVRNLVKWLAKKGGHELLIFVNKESIGAFEKTAPGVKTVLCPIRAESRPIRILWEQIALPVQAKLHKVDMLLSAGMTAPFLPLVPSVVVIYDLQHENQPENFSALYGLFLRAIIRLSAKTARAVITISGKSKSDIEKFYKIPAGRVGITYMASDKNVFYRRPPGEIASIKEKYKLPKRFILYIASSLPHKNYERLLRAYKLVRENDKDIKLVLIGARDYGQDAISKTIDELGIRDNVVFLGWLPFEDIPLVYCASDIFVFPSLHEGFGIPILEAFASGVPVVCSKIEPLTEVAGNAAFFVDPRDAEDMARGISAVLNDTALRERLIKDGLKRADDFSWEKTAADTISILESFNQE